MKHTNSKFENFNQKSYRCAIHFISINKQHNIKRRPRSCNQEKRICPENFTSHP